jgi:cobalt-zinc-cadmium efflux system outer membrane protein
MRQIIKHIRWILFVLPLSLSAQDTAVLSLNTILQRIDWNNVLLQSYELRAEGFKYSAHASTAWMAPMVGVGTFMTPYPGQIKMQPGDAGQLMLRLEQDIPNRSKLNARKRYIESQANVENATRRITLNDFKAQAKRLYYSWLVAEQRIKVLEQNEKIMVMMKKIEEVRYPYNQSQLGSVYKAEAKIEENRNMIRMQEGEIARARAYLNALMNRPGNEIFAIDTSKKPVFVPAIHDSASLLVRGDVIKMNENIRSMELNIQSMRQQWKPDFKIQYDHMYPLDATMPNQYSIMGMISIPIAPWASKMYKSEVRAIQLNVQAMEKERSAMLQETQGMLCGMQYEILSMQKRIKAMEEKVIPALQKTLDANFINYQENKLQLSLVIDSWEALTMMQLDLLDEKLKFYQMIVDHEKELYL